MTATRYYVLHCDGSTEGAKCEATFCCNDEQASRTRAAAAEQNWKAKYVAHRGAFDFCPTHTDQAEVVA